MNKLFVKIILYIMLLFSCWCGGDLFSIRSNPICTFDGTAMTMDYHIMVEVAQNDQQQVQKIISNTFSEINQIYNKWNNESEITKINQLKANEVIEISPELEHFFGLTEVIVKLSEGRFDPTIESLQQLWKNCNPQYQICF